jgi:hypothetical protein
MDERRRAIRRRETMSYFRATTGIIVVLIGKQENNKCMQHRKLIYAIELHYCSRGRTVLESSA